MEGIAGGGRGEVRIVLRGRVQGVGFRWFARESARRLGVSGWAGNLPDGSVVIEAGGAADALERFLSLVKAGPPHAEVTGVETMPRASAGPLPDSFTILR